MSSRDWRRFPIGICLGLVAVTCGCAAVTESSEEVEPEEPTPVNAPADVLYPEVEPRLKDVAAPLPKPGPGDWLAQHKEEGQTFDQYLRSKPVRKSETRNRIYLCLIGDFTKEQDKVLQITSEYLATFYQVPVEVHQRLALDKIPAEAKREHPSWGDKQILSTYVLDSVLKPSRPKNALAYIAFTSSDLWPGENWNFVFGQASLRDRVGVWSIYRNGDPAKSAELFKVCLARTMKTASHETGHILGLQHCIAYHCNMNGSNSLDESDREPMHFCPVCLRKLCWNLRADPVKYLQDLEKFCEKHELADDAKWYRQAREQLEKPE